MKMNETIDFILKNSNSLNPAVLRTVLGSIKLDIDEQEPIIKPTNPDAPADPPLQ